jgi:serine/threonine protein kinase
VQSLLTNEEKAIDEWLIKRISDENGFERSCDCWNEWFPTMNFGFTQSSLSFEEQLHFQAIESIFRSVFLFECEKWTLLKNLSQSKGITEIGPFCRNSIFVVKSESSEKNIPSLVEEYTLGKTTYNQLRKRFIPNFPYYFGVFVCQNTTHLIIENFHSCTNLTDFVKTTSNIKELTNILYQIVNALVFCFVEHNIILDDIKPDDVMIKRTDIDVNIPIASFSKTITTEFKTEGNIAILTNSAISNKSTSALNAFNQMIKRLIHLSGTKHDVFQSIFAKSKLKITDNLIISEYQLLLLDQNDIGLRKSSSFVYPQTKDVINMLNEWLTLKEPETSDIPLAHDVQMIVSLSKCCNKKYDSKLNDRFVHVYNRIINEEGPKSLFIPKLKYAYYQRFYS